VRTVGREFLLAPHEACCPSVWRLQGPFETLFHARGEQKDVIVAKPHPFVPCLGDEKVYLPTMLNVPAWDNLHRASNPDSKAATRVQDKDLGSVRIGASGSKLEP
jgi:hypothetical protein